MQNEMPPQQKLLVDFLNTKFFPTCTEKTVLEIGCFDGQLTEQIITHDPKQLILLEASSWSANLVQTKFLSAKVINGDMHKDLDLVGKVDVALVLGVIYHSHAPLLVLEDLVNFCDPQTIIIDNPANRFNVIDEKTNIPGMRYVVNNQKTCDLVISIDDKIITKALDNLGYDLYYKDHYPAGTRISGTPIYRFERRTNQ